MDTAAHTPDDPSLDERLSRDTLPLGDTSLSRILLARDSRWPWVILVPRREGISELHELLPADRKQLIEEIAIVSETLKAETACLKVNVAAIGNIVRQLHVHIVARTEGDPAWPGPIWGHGRPAPRADHGTPRFAKAVCRRLNAAYGGQAH